MDESTANRGAVPVRERDSDIKHVREIGHDEFDPIGTAVLIGLYFLVLASMWLFMYFVEFLGNGPTVVGAIAI